MHCNSLATLSRLSRFPSAYKLTFLCWRATKQRTNSKLFVNCNIAIHWRQRGSWPRLFRRGANNVDVNIWSSSTVNILVQYFYVFKFSRFVLYMLRNRDTFWLSKVQPDSALHCLEHTQIGQYSLLIQKTYLFINYVNGVNHSNKTTYTFF